MTFHLNLTTLIAHSNWISRSKMVTIKFEVFETQKVHFGSEKL